MKNKGIQIEVFCEFHNIDVQFIYAIIDSGFVDIVKEKDQILIPNTSIDKLERCVRLSNDLGVNIEGLEVINNMRLKIIELRKEVQRLKSLGNLSTQTSLRESDDDIIDFFFSDNE